MPNISRCPVCKRMYHINEAVCERCGSARAKVPGEQVGIRKWIVAIVLMVALAGCWSMVKTQFSRGESDGGRRHLSVSRSAQDLATADGNVSKSAEYQSIMDQIRACNRDSNEQIAAASHKAYEQMGGSLLGQLKVIRSVACAKQQIPD